MLNLVYIPQRGVFLAFRWEEREGVYEEDKRGFRSSSALGFSHNCIHPTHTPAEPLRCVLANQGFLVAETAFISSLRRKSIMIQQKKGNGKICHFTMRLTFPLQDSLPA